MVGRRSPMDKPWYKYYDEWVPASMDYPRIPLDAMLRDAAANHPDTTATIFGARVGKRLLDAPLSYRQLDGLVDRFAAGLQRMGVRKGDRVAIMLPNCP
ncbi:MAG: long-chain fatty acid--CoA ligase, partial [Chloroflexi bacterium]